MFSKACLLTLIICVAESVKLLPKMIIKNKFLAQAPTEFKYSFAYRKHDFKANYCILYRFHWTLTFYLIFFCITAVMHELQKPFWNWKYRVVVCKRLKCMTSIKNLFRGWNPNCVKISKAFAICSSRLLNFQLRIVYQIGCNLLSFFVVLGLCPGRARVDGTWLLTRSFKMPF